MNKCTLKEMILTAPAYTNTQPSKEEQNISAYNYRGLKSGVDPDNYPGWGMVPHEFISGEPRGGDIKIMLDPLLQSTVSYSNKCTFFYLCHYMYSLLGISKNILYINKTEICI